ncbi:MAG: Gfo/Idh/MocA family oxidoreductase [Tannerella sp.]|jgi:predicted dehydrogenase|nr:Gfo/Idh/MocA family oxidoreductase [Tannerella sp.]
MKKIKTGLASYGLSGQVFHAPFISMHPQFELTAIAERSKDLSRVRYPEARRVRRFDELPAMDDVELIVVNTPDSTHYEYARLALEAGKHVIVEKPFTNTVSEGEHLIALAEKQGKMLGVYQNRRWDADYLTVKEILEKEILGRPVEFESTFARYRNYIQPGTWKEQEGGMTYNLGSHLIDQSIQLFGLPEAVFADIAIQRTGGVVDDYFIIHLLRPDKAPEVRITLKAGYLMCEPEPRFVLHGTDGSYVKYGVDRQEALLKKGVAPDTPDWGVESEEEWGWFHSGKEGRSVKYPSLRGDYIGFYESVYQCLRHGAPLATDAREVLPVIRVIEAALKSSRCGNVVRLADAAQPEKAGEQK